MLCEAQKDDKLGSQISALESPVIVILSFFFLLYFLITLFRVEVFYP